MDSRQPRDVGDQILDRPLAQSRGVAKLINLSILTADDQRRRAGVLNEAGDLIGSQLHLDRNDDPDRSRSEDRSLVSSGAGS